MRNIIEYPITKREILDCLREIHAEALRDQAVGSMRALVIDAAVKIIEESPSDSHAG